MATSTGSTTIRATRRPTGYHTFASVLDELKVRAAYGQSGNLAPYGARVHDVQSDARRRGERRRPSNLKLGDAQHKAGVGTGGRDRIRRDVPSLARAVLGHDLPEATDQSSAAGWCCAVLWVSARLFINGGEFTNQGIELSLQATPVHCATVSRGSPRSRVTATTVSSTPAGAAVYGGKPIGIRQRLSRAGRGRIGDCEPRHHRDRRPPLLGG